MNRQELLNDFYALNATSKQLRESGASHNVMYVHLLSLAAIAGQLAELEG
jgi:hypothetical protein